MVLRAAPANGNAVIRHRGRKMEIGIVDYLLRLKEEACFYMAQGLGFDCLELSIDQIGDPNRLMFDPNRCDELIELWDATGVRISSVYATHFVRENIVHPDEQQRQPAVLALQSLAERSAKLGIGVIVLPLFGASELFGDHEMIALQQVLGHAASWGSVHKVRFALKTTMPCKQLAALIDRYQTQWIGVCYDPANSQTLGRDPIDDLKTLAGRIIHVHLKDRTLGGTTAGIGKGSIDIGRFFEGLKQINYRGPIVLETPAGKSAVEAAKSNLAATRQLIAA